MKWGIKTHPFLIGALVFSVLSGVLFFLVPSPEHRIEIDSTGYDRAGWHFAQTSHLINPDIPHDHPVTMFGYPLFVGLIYKGVGHSLAWVILAQWLLALLCGWLIFRIARQLCNERVATYAVMLWAANLGFLTYVQFLMTEIVLVALLLGFIDRFVTVITTHRVRTAAVAGLLLGSSVLIKPSALFFIVPAMILVMMFVKSSRKKRAAIVLSMGICFYLPILGYMARNKMTFGYFVLSPAKDEVLYRYFAARLKARLEHKDYDVVQQEQWFTGSHSLDDTGWDNARRYVHAALVQHPFIAAQIVLTNMLKTGIGLFSTQLKVLFNPEIKGGAGSFFKTKGSGFWRIHEYVTGGARSVWLRIVGYLEAAWTVLRVFLVLLGMMALWQQRQSFAFVFCVVYLGYFMAITGHDGSSRYRMPIEPILLILAAIGIDIMYRWLFSKKFNIKRGYV